MNPSDRIYLDNAATTWPKPEAVYEAVDRYQREIGGPNGRSGYREALEANSIVERARKGVAELIGADDPLEIVFGFSGTDVLESGDPRRRAAGRPCGDDRLRSQLGAAAAAGAGRAGGRRRSATCRATARGWFRRTTCGPPCGPTRGWWLWCTRRTSPGRCSRSRRLAESCASTEHCSWSTRPNRWGMCRSMCRRSTSTWWPRRGTRACWGRWAPACSTCGRASSRNCEPLRYGGTGSRSDEDRQPEELPDKFEPGNHNLLGLAGLVASCEFLANEIDRGDPRSPHGAHRAAARTAAGDRWRHDSRAAIDRQSHERREHHGRRLRSAGTGRRARIVAADPMPRRPPLCPADARSAGHDRRRRHAAAEPRLLDDARRDRRRLRRRLKKSPAYR